LPDVPGENSKGRTGSVASIKLASNNSITSGDLATRELVACPELTTILIKGILSQVRALNQYC